MSTTFRTMTTSFRALAVLTMILGLAYPLAMTGVAQVLFPGKANGSLIVEGDQVMGSTLIGQSFVDPETGRTLPGYFRARPSALDYAGDVSGGTNFGPTSILTMALIQQEANIVRDENGLSPEALIPIDLVTASGSGLDPDISPASAELQIARVARERNLPEDEVRDLVSQATGKRFLWIFGEPRVNVVKLNWSLDNVSAAP